ncbi:putative disease resistance protein RGA3 [Macadamia integrifolia]|uniref:putative disease resistance protein RGA3 n=1 Tax=Macadamia integrifolia TaxID=60698 RepID=UPI001C533ACD|nr:putative disease resistance protein RGA3 [Macadamia integrifolia]XP_042520584.1 putative disease resistance protein RGA3 [Macadamia integrifolia]XP_042520585.1 putative disease resistance protein RGA3 [Macadamia integrifolia]
MASRLTRADIVVSPTVQAILNKLDDPLLLQDFGSMWCVERELYKLYCIMERIKTILEVVENKQRKDGLMKHFLEDLRSLVYYIDDVLDEFLTEIRKLRDDRIQSKNRNQVPSYLSFSLNENHMLSRKDIGPFVNKINEELAVIEEKLVKHYFQGQTELIQHEMFTRVQAFPSGDRSRIVGSIVDQNHVFGRKDDLCYVSDMLLSDQYDGRGSVSVVSIVAMGGMGKTTLAQLLYNHNGVINHFEVRVWVSVSDQFDVVRLSGEILTSATRQSVPHFEQLDPLQRGLEDAVRGKRILIVLDDVWNEKHADWEKLFVPFRVASKGSRILVTTRSDKVSFALNAIATHYLRALCDEDATLLFKDRAFIDPIMNANSTFEAIGNEILKKCDGLPLAINTLARLLQGKQDQNQWKFILESEMWDIGKDDIFLALSLSYHHLPPHLKQCFAYCSLFPKDSEFTKETLVSLWVAGGFIQTKQLDKMEDIGRQYFDDLLHRSFFQSSSCDGFMMHNLMHDLACLVSAGVYFRPEDNISYHICENVRHMFLANLDFDLAENRSYRFKRLSSFLFICERMNMQGHHILNMLIAEFKCLRVLVLDAFWINSLPYSIGNLKHLRFFRISSDTIEKLPESICALYNLQVLDVVNCRKLIELPEDIFNLVNLQRLRMEDKWWDVERRPKKMGKLKCLKEIPFFHVGLDVGHGISELKELVNLEGTLGIESLEFLMDIREAKDASLKNKQKIDKLWLEWGCSRREKPYNFCFSEWKHPYYKSWEDVLSHFKHWEDVLEVLEPHKGLKVLEIMDFPGLCFPTWMTTNITRYSKLVTVKLYRVESESLPPLGQLPCLETLKISCSHKNKIRQLTAVFYGNIGGRKGFQKLKSLTFGDMDSLQEWCEAEGGEFPCLQSLHISGCPKLRRLPRLLPSTERLTFDITSCHSLTSLDCGLNTSLKELHVSNCDGIRSLAEDLYRFTSLQRINISYCSQLEVLFSDECLISSVLEDLRISYCEMLKTLPKGLCRSNSLKTFEIDHCPQLSLLFSDAKEEGPSSALESFHLLGLDELRSFSRISINYPK